MNPRLVTCLPLLFLLAACAAGKDGQGQAGVDPNIQRLAQIRPESAAARADAATMAEMNLTRGPGWLLVAGNPDNGVSFVHMPGLTRQGPLATGWVLTNHWTPQRAADGSAYVSTMMQLQFDCANWRNRTTELQVFAERGARGGNRTFAGPPGAWGTPGPSSFGEGMMRAACGFSPGGAAAAAPQQLLPPAMTGSPPDARGPAKTPL